MLRALFLTALLASCSYALDKTQLKGMMKLLKKLPSGVYPTCNLVLFSEQVDYDTADEKCKNFNIGTATAQKGNLATVNDADKNADLKLLLNMAYPISKDDTDKWGPDKWVWAGLRKVTNNGVDDGSGKKSIFSKKYNALDWNWFDGSNPKDFHNWFNRKQPDQAIQKKGQSGCENDKCLQNQMRINHHGKWDDTYKYKKHPYACDYQGKYILSATPKVWLDAKEACEAAGLMLAKVRGGKELDEITNAAKFFLGPRDESLKVFDSSNWFWIGGNDLKEEGAWEWTDGEKLPADMVEKMPWRKPNPDNAEKIGKVGQDVLSISKWGEFDDSYNTRRKRPFACQCPGT